MSGIFFEGGVTCSMTVNAQCNPVLAPDCYALYYSQRCNVGVNPLQMNAVISELVNAINTVNDAAKQSPYDCTRLDNLKTVLENIRNLGKQPELAVEIQLDDRIAGFFDDKSGTITVEELLEWFMGQIAVICDLEIAENPQRDATLVAACVNGEERSLTGFQVGNMALGGRGYQYYDFMTPTRRRFNSVWYQNKTPLPIEVNICCADDAGLWYSAEGAGLNQVLINSTQSDGTPLTCVIPPDHWYAVFGANSYRWSELRLTGTQND